MSINTALSNSFQKEIASIVTRDRNFATKFYSLILGDEDLRKQGIKIFSSGLLSQVMKIQQDLFVKSEGILPSLGIYENYVLDMDTSESNKESLTREFKSLIEMNMDFNNLHEKGLIELLLMAKTTSFVNSIFKDFETPNKELLLSLANKCRDFVDKIDNISLRDSDKVDMEDFVEIIKQYADNSVSNIRFGIPELCEQLNGGGETGGLAKQEITAWLAATNDGKTMVMTSITSDAIRNGENVLLIGLEGKRLQIPMRIISNLADIPYKKLVTFREYINKNDNASLEKYFTKEDLDRLYAAQKLYGEKVTVIHAIKNSEIEKLEAMILTEFKSKYYGMTIIDYGQLIESVQNHGNTDLLLAYVFRKLEKLASRLNTSMNIPMQTNRTGMSELKSDLENGEEYPTYKMHHVAGGYSAFKTAGCIIALSRTQEERDNRKIRYSILKQREGDVGIHVGIQGDFAHCNLTRGERYYVVVPGLTDRAPSKSQFSISDLGLDDTNESVIQIVNQVNILKEISEFDNPETLAKFNSKIKNINGIQTRLKILKEEKEMILLSQDVSEDEVQVDIKELEDQLLNAKFFDDELSELFLEIFESKERIKEFSFAMDKISGLHEQIKIEFSTLAQITHSMILAKDLELLNEYN